MRNLPLLLTTVLLLLLLFDQDEVLAHCSRNVAPSEAGNAGHCGHFFDAGYSRSACCDAKNATYQDPPDLTRYRGLPPCRDLSPGCALRYQELVCKYTCDDNQHSFIDLDETGTERDTIHLCMRSAECLFRACRSDEWLNYSDGSDLKSCIVVGDEYTGGRWWINGWWFDNFNFVTPEEEAAGRTCLVIDGCETEESIGWAGGVIGTMTLGTFAVMVVVWRRKRSQTPTASSDSSQETSDTSSASSDSTSTDSTTNDSNSMTVTQDETSEPPKWSQRVRRILRRLHQRTWSTKEARQLTATRGFAIFSVMLILLSLIFGIVYTSGTTAGGVYIAQSVVLMLSLSVLILLFTMVKLFDAFPSGSSGRRFVISTAVGAFVASSAVFVVLTIFSIWIVLDPVNVKSHVLIGAVGPNDVRLFAHEPDEDKYVLLHWRPVTNPPSGWSSEVQIGGYFQQYTATFHLHGLEPTTLYEATYFFPPKSAPGNAITRFTTAPPRDKLSSVRFAFGSCILEEAGRSLSHLAEIAEQRPDFNVLLGDLIYADIPFSLGDSRDIFRDRYLAVYNNEHAYKLFNTVPTYTMFDDHEVINNWAKQSVDFDKVDNALFVWREFVGDRNPPSPGGFQGYYFHFGFGSAIEVFVTEHRWNRESDSFFGRQQQAALESWLLTSNATFKFVASTIVLSNRYRGERWPLTTRDQLLQFVVNNRITGVVFLSADQHTGGILKLDPPTAVVNDTSGISSGFFELSASPWEANPADDLPEPRGPDRTDDVEFYINNLERLHGLVDYFGDAAPNKFQVQFCGAGNEVFFATNFTLCPNGVVTRGNDC